MKNMSLKLMGSLLAVAFAPALVSAQNLNGTWQVTSVIGYSTCLMTTVINNGQYSETVQCPGVMTWQTGTYTMQGNFLVRQVHDFEPKTRYIVDGRPLGYDYTCPDGRYRCPGWYGGPGAHYPLGPGGHYEANATPPGGSFYVTFHSANSMTWQDANHGGSVTFQRAQ